MIIRATLGHLREGGKGLDTRMQEGEGLQQDHRQGQLCRRSRDVLRGHNEQRQQHIASSRPREKLWTTLEAYCRDFHHKIFIDSFMSPILNILVISYVRFICLIAEFLTPTIMLCSNPC